MTAGGSPGGPRTAAVTGSSGGIGRATVAAFREAGWRTAGLDVDESGAGDGAGGPDLFRRVDVSDADAVEDAFRDVEAELGPLDALVNNAAVQGEGEVRNTGPEEWDRVVDTNLRGVFLCVRAALPLLEARRGGAVVNVSSVHARATSRGLAAYAASKGGLSAFTRSLALELADAGIRVNAVLPGAVDTAMLREGLGRGHLAGSDVEERIRELGERHALGRVGRPEEVARAIRFLADGELASFITGECLVVDGGALARLSTE